MIFMANLSYINHYCFFLKSRDCILGLSPGPGTLAIASILMKGGDSELMTESTPLPILACHRSLFRYVAQRMEKFPGSTAHPGWTAMESLTLSCATCPCDHHLWSRRTAQSGPAPGSPSRGAERTRAIRAGTARTGGQLRLSHSLPVQTFKRRGGGGGPAPARLAAGAGAGRARPGRWLRLLSPPPAPPICRPPVARTAAMPRSPASAPGPPS